MGTLIRRILTVLAALLLLVVACQFLMKRDFRLTTRFTLTVQPEDPNGKAAPWRFAVNQFEQGSIDGSPAGVEVALARLRSARGGLTITAVDDANRLTLWTASRDAAGKVLLNGQASNLDEVARRIIEAARPPADFRPTRPVTVKDVLEANIPTPTRSKVSFPAFSYKQAFPQATDEPEIVIAKFDEAPMLKDLSSMPQEWRKFYPETLPPVEERLPRNPAVVVGPDGIGQYGGVWRRCVTAMFDFYTKLCTESFARYDPSGHLQPCLAYKWDVSPDNRVYTLYLRKGHKWSDGHPFTTEDILWTCNVVVGSATIGDPPDWMQATDGSMMLYVDDVNDWRELSQRIVAEAQSPPSVGAQVKAFGSPRLWKNLQALAGRRGDSPGAAGGPGADEETISLVTADLNDVFRVKEFYRRDAFARVDPNAELRKLEAVGASRLDGNRLDQLMFMLERGDLLRLANSGEPNALEMMYINRLNLLMFRSAYGDLVCPPVKQRVIVEAVPDETGDTSHIIRFTFRRPNSLFVEHWPTFMFYRLLSACKHTSAPLHPDGSQVLAPFDVLDWENLFQKVRQQAQAPEPSPGKQLWNLLEEPIRQRIEADPPKAASPDAYKQQVIDAVNKALADRRFYDPDAFGSVRVQPLKDRLFEDLKERLREKKEDLRKVGFAELFRGLADMLEYRDLLILEDLLKRFREEGPGPLRDEQVLKLGVMMFRAAYSEDPKNPLVARTRTVGLDEKAKKHPRKYTGWQTLYQDRGNYHPVYNPHEPRLAAWRIVSEKDAPEILAVRNPYYYRVDAQGNQLPYINAIRTTISTGNQIRLLKLTSGNIDCQSREITFDDFVPLKQNEDPNKGDFEARLWANDYCGEVTFTTEQCRKDPMWAKINEDPNFRHALSLAVNRQEIIDVVFNGLGRPAQFSIPEGSPYYSEAMAKASVAYDPVKAGRLLDAMGLDKRAGDGTRLFWDGRRIIMDVNTDGLVVPNSATRLLCVYWQAIGIDAQLKFRTNQMLYRLDELGENDLRVHKEGGNYFGPFPPGSYYPSHPAECTQWYQWANYLRNGGRRGWPAPERIRELERMWQKMVEAPNHAVKMRAWKAITDRFAADLPLAGIMTSPGKIIYVRNGFMNVPKIGLAGWIAHEPGNACPECFFFDYNYRKPLER